MGITFGDHLIDSGYFDITREQEREIEAREECVRRGIAPDELCADGGIVAWMVVDQERIERHRFPQECDCRYFGECDGSCTHPAPRPSCLPTQGHDQCR